MKDTQVPNIHSILAQNGQIAFIWSIADVQQVRPDFTAEQAWEVLATAQRQHDAEFGINWLTLECIAEEMFGAANATDQTPEAV